jgi:cyclophilin family peptidyl-prolyl cis-trans isomerase
MKRLLLAALTLALAAGCASEPTSSPKDKGKDKSAGKEKSARKDKGGSDEKNPVVVMKTSLGTIKIELFPDEAPITVKNFLTYVDEKFYDGTIFHRVAQNPNVIQGGGLLPSGKEKATKHDAIRNEAGNGLSNERGTIAMARTSEPHSATCQFYINAGDNLFLDRDRDPKAVGYCVFGKVIEGMDVVDKIKDVETRGSRPVKDVVIESVRRADKK